MTADTFMLQRTTKRYTCIKNLYLGAWNIRICKTKFAKGIQKKKLASSVFPVLSPEAGDMTGRQLRVNIEPASLNSHVLTTSLT